MTWSQAKERQLERLQSRGLAPGTLARIALAVDDFVSFCRSQGLERPRDLDASHLAQYQRQLAWTLTSRGRLPAPSTVAGRLTSVRSFVRELVSQGHLLVDPTRDLVLPRVPRPLIRLLTPQEVAWLLEAPNPRTIYGRRDRALLETFYGIGLRREECRRLDLADYDLVQQTLRVRWTKSRLERRLPVAAGLQAVLETYLSQARPALVRQANEPAFFLSNQGRRLSVARLDQIVARTARSVGLKGVGPHALRHAFATHLLARGADLRHVQALLGHQALASTERYTHLQPLEVCREHQRTHPRARRPGPDPWAPNSP